MKKLLYCAAALAMAFFAGSCQQEKLEPVAGNGTVTFTVEAPANVQTKAIADGLNVTELVYEVWLTNELGELTQNAQKLYQATTTMAVENGVNKASITLDLVNDQKFTVLFWAQVQGTSVYDTQELTAVHYTNTAAEAYAANDERLAAFYAVAYVNDCRHVKKDGTPTGSEVTLRRPFAQLNLGTLNTSTAYDVELVSSKVKVTNANTEFNVATSVASEPKVIEFLMNSVPTDPSTLEVSDVDYEYAGMNYLFAGDNATVEYDIVTKLNDGMEGTVNNTVSSVPLKENYRTNIVGNLLTSKVDYQIVVDADFNTPAETVDQWNGELITAPVYNAETQTYTIDEAADLAWLAAAVNGTLTRAEANTFKGQTFKLESDIDLNNSLWTPIGYWETFEGTFDGGNHTISNLNVNATEADCYLGLFGCTNNAVIKNLNIHNASIKASVGDNSWAGGHLGALVGYPDGTTVIENVKLTGDIKVEGPMDKTGAQRIGAVVGGFSAASLTLNNVTVDASEDSYVKGNLFIGGVVGAPLCPVAMTNVTSNIDVYSQAGIVGGIAGYLNPRSVLTNCSSSGDVRRLETAADATENQIMRIGGIAGSYDGTVTLEGCEYSGTLYCKDASGNDVYMFENNGLVGRCYGDEGNLIITNSNVLVYASNVADIQRALSNAQNTTLIINFLNDINGNVTIRQKVGVDVIINGLDKKFDGTFYLEGGMQGGSSPETLTFKNIHFNHTAADAVDFISADDAKTVGKRYAHNVTVEDCTFTAGAGSQVMAMRYRQTYNMTVKNVTATGLYGLIWTTGANGVVVDNVTTSGKNGISTGTSTNITIKNSDITAQVYGVRADGTSGNPSLKIENTTINAVQPVIVRKMTGSALYAVALSNVTLNTEELYQVVFTNGSDDETYVTPTGNYTITGADDLLIFPRDNYGEKVVDGLYKNVTKDGTTYNVTTAAGLKKLNEMFVANSAGKVTLNLKNDIDFSSYTWVPVDSHVDRGSEIDEINGNGYTISNLEIKGQAMFTRFAGSGDVVIKDITFDNATVDSNGNINTSILTVQTYQNVLLDNVDVKNSSITGGYKVAPLIGTVYNESTSTVTATLKNCDVENVTVKATSYDFCTTGMVAFVYAEDNDKIVFENCTVKDVKLYAPTVYTAHAAVYTEGSDVLFNEAVGVTVENVTFENI